MVSFNDPVTDTRYNPIGNPSGFAKKYVYTILGISLTAIAAGIALTQVVPTLGGLLGRVSGGRVNPGSGGAAIPVRRVGE